MSDYTIIADVSQYILKTLREKMCPEPIPSPNNIEVISPVTQDLDYTLGLYLYDMKIENEMGMPQFMPKGSSLLQKSPTTYALYYMIYVNTRSQAGLKDLDIQKILGRVAQIIEDNQVISPNDLQEYNDMREPQITLTQARISMDEKVRVWQAIQKPYQVSLFYKAAPILISSEMVYRPKRVISADLYVTNMEGREE